jgi:hypothetical protein
MSLQLIKLINKEQLVKTLSTNKKVKRSLQHELVDANEIKETTNAANTPPDDAPASHIPDSHNADEPAVSSSAPSAAPSQLVNTKPPLATPPWLHVIPPQFKGGASTKSNKRKMNNKPELTQSNASSPVFEHPREQRHRKKPRHLISESDSESE